IFEGTNEILRAFIALVGVEGPAKQLTDLAKLDFASALREPIKGFGVLSDFALQRARRELGREKLELAHPLLRHEASIFEAYAAKLARETDSVLIRHGKETFEMQFVQKRLAEVAVDLYALAAVLSRTTRALEQRGEPGAARELELARGFARIAEHRIRVRFDHMDDDADEALKRIAATAYKDGSYTFDVV
ncbi:MAG: acyl-CoA dehydrogenase, partial [Myxococcales bacterium]|nr:acyl-CoA dehydrogenase [Myxococcales bacterium]